MSNFKNLRTTKKGTAAEDMLINEFVLSKGYIPYTPSVSMSHPYDACGVDKNGDTVFLLDIKCKDRLIYHPTVGIDTADLEKYKGYTKPIYILFADPSMGEVYGQWLRKLEPVAKYQTTTTFALSAMTHYRYLTDNEVNILKNG